MSKTLREFLEENHLNLNDNAKLLFEKLNLPMNILTKLEEEYGKSDKMSKSKHNTVDPDEMIQKYGADTVRLYTLFAAPPQNNFDWIESGVEGAHRFLKRVWNFVNEIAQDIKDISYTDEDFKNLNKEDKELRKKLHQTIKKVNEDITREYQFNTAVAAIMEFFNYLSSYEGKNKKVLKESVENLILLLSVFTPFIADEMWNIIGKEGFTIQQKFPEPDEKALIEEEIEIPVQINGKMRGKVVISVDASEDEALTKALHDENIKKWIEGKQIVKTIFVKGKILNIIVKG
jgi:leucyl-tRNA synthetase